MGMKKLMSVIAAPWFFRRLAMIWACWLCTVIVFKSFQNIELLTPSNATLFATYFGVLASIVAFYHRDREQDTPKEDVNKPWRNSEW